MEISIYSSFLIKDIAKIEFYLRTLSIPFYDFPSSPILIIGALGIAVAIVVFFVAYQKYFNSPLNKELTKKKKGLIKEKKELIERLERIEQELKNL